MAEYPKVEERGIRGHLEIILPMSAGVVSGEFFGEYAARKANQTGWNKTWLKGIVKTVWGAFWLYLSTKVADPRTKKYLESAGYGSMSTIILDILSSAYPGGVVGMATALTLAGAPVRQTLPTLRRAITGLPRTIPGRVITPLTQTTTSTSTQTSPCPSCGKAL